MPKRLPQDSLGGSQAELVKQNIKKQIDEYLQGLAERNYAATTIIAYEQYLKELAEWLAQRGLGLEQLGRAALSDYLSHVNRLQRADGQPMKSNSRRKRMLAIRQWLFWLFKLKALSFNLGATIELPREEKRLPGNVLSESEVERVLACVDVSQDIGVRDRAILEVLYSTGMRCRELCNLRLENLELENGLIWVRQGKGKKDRVVPVGARAVYWLKRHLEESRPELTWTPGESSVFLTQYGRPFVGSSMSVLVHRRLGAAGLGDRGACHVWRHSMATQMLANGADIRTIQAILGHENISSTQIYTRVEISALREVHCRTHPAAKAQLKEAGPCRS